MKTKTEVEFRLGILSLGILGILKGANHGNTQVDIFGAQNALGINDLEREVKG